MTKGEIATKTKLLERLCHLARAGAYVISAGDALFLIKQIKDLKKENKDRLSQQIGESIL